MLHCPAGASCALLVRKNLLLLHLGKLFPATLRCCTSRMEIAADLDREGNGPHTACHAWTCCAPCDGHCGCVRSLHGASKAAGLGGYAHVLLLSGIRSLLQAQCGNLEPFRPATSLSTRSMHGGPEGALHSCCLLSFISPRAIIKDQQHGFRTEAPPDDPQARGPSACVCAGWIW